MRVAGGGCGPAAEGAGASVRRVMLQPGLPSVRTKNNAVNLMGMSGRSVPSDVSTNVGVLDYGMGLGATGVCSKSLLDKLCDMCYDGILKGPERREQVSLVGFPLS
jgi:hypothetical protein